MQKLWLQADFVKLQKDYALIFQPSQATPMCNEKGRSKMPKTTTPSVARIQPAITTY
jgi:hypothetical protein